MKLNQPLIISLLLHFCLYLLTLSLPQAPLFPPRTQDVEIVYQNKTPPRLFVTDPNPQETPEQLLEKLKDRARYLSRVTRRVEKELAAPRTGRTQNSAANPMTRAERERREELKDLNGDAPSITRPLNQVGQNARLAESSLSEYIPEVRTGGFTALNSDQFVHYTFYARINEQVRNRWINLIRDFIDSSPAQEINRLAQKTQISQIEIVLTPEGHFVKALIHRQSESVSLDERAAAAFRLAAPFNNPPSEMIEPDGMIHLHYGFHVHFRPKYYANRNGQ